MILFFGHPRQRICWSCESTFNHNPRLDIPWPVNFDGEGAWQVSRASFVIEFPLQALQGQAVVGGLASRVLALGKASLRRCVRRKLPSVLKVVLLGLIKTT